MNAKTAKALRQSVREVGLDPSQVEYDDILVKKVPLLDFQGNVLTVLERRTRRVKKTCGRGVYLYVKAQVSG